MTPEQAKAQQEMQALAQGAVEAMRAGRDDEAIQKFNEILAKQPDVQRLLLQPRRRVLEEAAVRGGRRRRSRRPSRSRPNSADAYTGLANVYNAQKKFDLAQQASAKAAELAGAGGAGGGAEGLYNQGVILWNAGKYAEAKVQFEAAVKADPNDVDGALSARHGQPESRTDSRRHARRLRHT